MTQRLIPGIAGAASEYEGRSAGNKQSEILSGGRGEYGLLYTVGYRAVYYEPAFKYGEVKHPSLGLELEPSWSTIVGLPTLDPLTVTKVNSAEARKAGVAEDDVLYSIDGHRVVSLVDINELFKSYSPGTTVRLVMQSDGDIVIRKLVLTQGDPLLSEEGSGTDGDEHTEE